MGIKRDQSQALIKILGITNLLLLHIFTSYGMESWDYQPAYTTQQEDLYVPTVETEQEIAFEDRSVASLFNAIAANDFEAVKKIVDTPYFSMEQRYKDRSIALAAFREFANRAFKDLRIFLYLLIKGAPVNLDDNLTIQGFIRGYTGTSKDELNDFINIISFATEQTNPTIKAAAFYDSLKYAKPFLKEFNPRSVSPIKDPAQEIESFKNIILGTFGEFEDETILLEKPEIKEPLDRKNLSFDQPLKDSATLLSIIKSNDVQALETIDPTYFALEDSFNQAWFAFKKRGYKDARTVIYLIIKGSKVYPSDSYILKQAITDDKKVDELLNALIDASSALGNAAKAQYLYDAIELALPFLKSKDQSAERNALWLKNEVLFEYGIFDLQRGESEEEFKEEMEEWEFLEKPSAN